MIGKKKYLLPIRLRRWFSVFQRCLRHGISIFVIAIMLSNTASLYAKTIASSVEAYGIDTIVGYSALLKAKNALPNEIVEFWIRKATGAELFLESQSNEEGIAELDLYDYHTKKAGMYEIAAKMKTEENFGPASTFRIYADKVSDTQSLVSIDKNTAIANNTDKSTINVLLKDQYGNPIPNHTVELIGSRSGDTVTSKKSLTDDKGSIRFEVTSSEPGISIYSVYDTTANITLKQRVKIAYYASNKNRATEIGGFTSVLMAQNDVVPESASYLKIEDIGDIASPNEIMTFSVTAYDKNDNPATNYLGIIHFASTDENASLPIDYTFTEDDLGKHTFSLGLKFLTEGVQTLEVIDTENIELKGTKTMNVTDEIDNPGDDMTIAIMYPQDGTYSESSLEMEGTAPMGWTIEIYDNDEKIGETIAGSNDDFRFNIKNLQDGLHTLYATIIDSENQIIETSKKISVNIDTSAPLIDEILINGQKSGGNVSPGETLTIEIYSEVKLATISVIIDGNIYELTEDLDQAGYYRGNIAAPEIEGDYLIDIIMMDQLGNESSLPNKALLKVNGENELAPTQVTGVEAKAQGDKIVLNWEASSDDTYVSHYRIYYGEDEKNLKETVDTKDSATTWYISNLIAGTDYFLALTAVDSEGNESLEKSEIIASTPNEIIYPDTVAGVIAKEEVEKITLTWTPAKDDTYISYYRIYYGTDANTMDIIVNTFDDNTSWYIDNLVGGVTHYFAITAIDSDGNESIEKSEVIRAVPKAPPAPEETPESGPAGNLLLILTLFGAEAYVLKRYFEKRKMFAKQYEKGPLQSKNSAEDATYYDLSI